MARVILLRLCMALAVIALLSNACDDGSSSMTRSQAINTVYFSADYGRPSGTPPPGGDYACTIYGGGPPPGIEIKGNCRWDAERDGDGWIVSDAQTWKCADFTGAVEGYPACNAGTGSHTWRNRVDANGEITYLGRAIPAVVSRVNARKTATR